MVATQGGWNTYATGKEFNAYGSVHRTYASALAAILSHFSNYAPPAGMCPNCFLFHADTPCASPTYDWDSFVDATIHPRCSHCGLLHHYSTCRLHLH